MAAAGFTAIKTKTGRLHWPDSGLPKEPMKKPIWYRSSCAPVSDQQCGSLHTAVPCLVSGGPAGEYRVRCCDRILFPVPAFRCDYRDRREPDCEPSGRSNLYQNAAQRAELFVLDPRGQALDRYAAASLRFTPGTDVALLNAMINTIITEELYDKAYVEAHTEGFANLADQTAAMTPEAMAPVCGIEAEVIRDVARRFAGAKAGMIFGVWGLATYAWN